MEVLNQRSISRCRINLGHSFARQSSRSETIHLLMISMLNLSDEAKAEALRHNFTVDVGILDMQGTWDHGTALHEAVSAQNPRAITMLLDKGADPLVANKEGVTSQHAASLSSHSATRVRLLARPWASRAGPLVCTGEIQGQRGATRAMPADGGGSSP